MPRFFSSSRSFLLPVALIGFLWMLLLPRAAQAQYYPAYPVAGFTSTGSTTVLRIAHTATLLANGKVLIAGGGYSSAYGSPPLSGAELYDPTTGRFTPTGSMNALRSYHAATLLPDGKVLVTGGLDNLNRIVPSAELYDPATGLFTLTGSPNDARFSHTSTLLGNSKVLITGGSGISSYLSSAELYDPATGVFTSTARMSAYRHEHTATLLANGKVLVAGNGADLYDPATGIFTPAATGGADGHTATLLADGKALIAGGGTNGPSRNTARLFDPTTGISTPVGPMTSNRKHHTATLLADGRVLLAGGTDWTGVSNTELYDPATGTFIPSGTPYLNSATGHLETLGKMQAERSYHTATLLISGKVLMTGGSGNTVAELFRPRFPLLSINNVTQSEGNGSTVDFAFTITRTGDTTVPSSVHVSTASGSATAGEDFTDIADTTVTFAPGEATRTVSVAVNGDAAVEADETFTVTLSNPANAYLGIAYYSATATATATGTIINDDFATAISGFTPVRGPVGTSVTIVGTNFTGATKVSFGTQSASSYTVVSPTEITAIVPTGAVTNAISITTPRGTETSGSAFVVTELPSLIVSTDSDDSTDTDSLTSLREAIALANSNADESAISFDPTFFNTSKQIRLARGFSVSANLSISGPAAGVVLDRAYSPSSGDSAFSFFHINAGVSAGMKGLTISQGSTGIVNHGVLSITNCTVSTYAGGIINFGTATLTGSILSSNAVSIYNHNTATLTITHCTLIQSGYGINNLGTTTVANCTLSRNNTGIVNSGSATVTNCTLADNNSSGVDNTGTILLRNSLLTGRTYTHGVPDNINNRNSMWYTAAQAGVEVDANGNPVLKDNGGPVPTIALMPGSPVINAGNNAFATGLAFDGRGPGFARIKAGTVDIGAFEVQNTAPPVAMPVPAFTTPQNVPKTLTLAGTDVDGDVLSFIITKLPARGMLYDGANLGVPITKSPYTVKDAQHRVTFSAFSAGTGSFGFKVNDGTFDSAPQIVNFTVIDTTPPLVAITVPGDKKINNLTAITGIASDNIGVVRVELLLQKPNEKKFWNGTQWAPLSSASTLPTVLTPIPSGVAWSRTTGLPSGHYLITVRAFDAAGNSAATTSAFWKKEPVPTPAVSAPIASSLQLSSAVAKNGTIRLTFTGALGVGATDAANYTVLKNGAPTSLQSVQQPSANEVVITVDGLAPGARVSMTYNLKDTQGRSVSGTTTLVVQ